MARGDVGDVILVAFTLNGHNYQALNGGTPVDYGTAASIAVECPDQADVDRLWEALTANGPLAHILKNRFYIGEIAYRGKIYKGEHEAIIDREQFEAVQRRLAGRAVQRREGRAKSKSVLTGLIFDDRGNPMSPSHAYKKCVRYRYYVSQAIIQNRKAEAGSVARVSAPDVEAIVSDALRENMAGGRMPSGTQIEPETEAAESSASMLARESIMANIERVIVHRSEIEIVWRRLESASNEMPARQSQRIPFEAHLPLRKGVAHSSAGTSLDPKSRKSLLDEIMAGEVQSLDEIAARENLVERYVRRSHPA